MEIAFFLAAIAYIIAFLLLIRRGSAHASDLVHTVHRDAWSLYAAGMISLRWTRIGRSRRMAGHPKVAPTGGSVAEFDPPAAATAWWAAVEVLVAAAVMAAVDRGQL